MQNILRTWVQFSKLLFGFILAMALTGCNTALLPFVTTTTVSAPECDGSSVPSLSGPMSVGGTGGCISSISSALEAEANDIRNSSEYRFQSIYHSVGGSTIRSNSLIASGFEYAHALNLTGAGQTIAVYDNGFNPDHLEFWAKDIDYADGRTESTVFVAEHGTSVAALAAGSGDWGRTIGGAPNASLFLSSWEHGTDQGSVEDAEAIGAIALNNSWSYTCSGDPFDECGINDYGSWFLSSSHRNALLNYAGDEGIVLFAASNEEAQTQATYMSALPQLIPALEEGWLAVINVARDYDTSQPGLFDDSNVGLMSSGCLEAARWCIAADGTSMVATNSLSDYSEETGTSFATPRVAAAVAILAEAFPNLSASEIRNRILVTADNDFFAGDTANIQTLNFADGLSHDYHWVYGHGFLDLKSALLPIGRTTTSTSKGDQLDLTTPTIIAGGASGDAIRQALSKVSLHATDQLGGTYEAPAEALVATSQTNYQSAHSLARLNSAGDWNDLSAVNIATPFETTGGINVPILIEDAKLELLLPADANCSTGMRLSRSYTDDQGKWTLGASHVADPNALMGISLNGHGNLPSDAIAVDAQYERNVTSKTQMILRGQAGTAQAQTSSFFSSIEPVTFGSLGIQLKQNDAFLHGDSVSAFANRPTAILSGTATAGLKSTASSSYQDIEIPLAPTLRETEIGFEYVAQGNQGQEWLVQVSRRFNASNIAENTVNSITLGVRKQF